VAAELVGDQGEVENAGPGDGAATELLADQQGGPAQFGAALPVLGFESCRVVPEPTNRVLRLGGGRFRPNKNR